VSLDEYGEPVERNNDAWREQDNEESSREVP